MEDATFRLNMVYTLAAGTAQRPFAAAPVAVCNRRMQNKQKAMLMREDLRNIIRFFLTYTLMKRLMCLILL